MIEQECHEWGIKMWTATIDFTKAFDSIAHKSIWDAFKYCNILFGSFHDFEHVTLYIGLYCCLLVNMVTSAH